MRTAVIVTCVIVGAVMLPRPAAADDIKVLSSVGIKAVVEALAPQFEKATKHKVTTVFDLSATVKKNIDSGAPFDVAIMTPALIDDLIAKGTIASASRTVIARVGLGLMTRAGAKKLDVSTVDAFKKTLVDAKAITFVPAGASGVAFLATVKKLGIADTIKTKEVASGEEVNANVTSGAADIAILPVSEILPVKGAQLGGVFPADVQTFVVMAAGVNAKTSGTAAQEFVSFLMKPANNAVIREKGMERPK
ncbi:MAG TPA: molybdate ABC transporter substrate-binding protein [Vicinamibacterales bacterium]|jgi:molybdate transport system substrate-binding protein